MIWISCIMNATDTQAAAPMASPSPLTARPLTSEGPAFSFLFFFFPEAFIKLFSCCENMQLYRERIAKVWKS